MDASAELPVEDAVDVERGELRVVGQQFVDGLFNLGKPGGGILELQQLLDTEELPAFENGLVLMVNKDITIRGVCLADEHKADTKLLHVGSKLFLVGTEITVLLQDGPQLLASPIVGVEYIGIYKLIIYILKMFRCFPYVHMIIHDIILRG